MSRPTVARWISAGYLHPRLPRVHAIGSPARTHASDLFEAILYAGPCAMLSHASAAHHHALIDHPPVEIHVRTPRRRRSLPGIVVHGRSTNVRAFHRGLPVTTLPDTLLDLATQPEAERLLRRALARLDYMNRLHPDHLITHHCRPGRPGSAALRAAIAAYDPRFAHTYSPLEDDWILVCEATGTPKPDAVNVLVHGIRCDAVYEDAMTIVELDGIDNHRSPAQLRRDRRNDFTLRAHGWLVLRYGSDQIRSDLHGVAAEVRATLKARAGRRHPRARRRDSA
ncbi:MAG TPA: DUF559 domain-containing protein [Solirubrobacteraceae bacterium]|nr:DUF559 domain-containing protein [Solirubrobacteraceae bacterium]